MRRSVFLIVLFTTVITLVLPFVGGSGPSLFGSISAAHAGEQPGLPVFATPQRAASGMSQPVGSGPISVANFSEETIAHRQAVRAVELTKDSEHLAQKPIPAPVITPPTTGSAHGASPHRTQVLAAGGTCPSGVSGSTNSAPSRVSAGGVAGTTSTDLSSFARTYNSIRVANCLTPIPLSHIRYDSCMETRLFWMAEDPSTDVNSAWGHLGSHRSDGVPSVGCDGNLAGGYGNTGATVATKWWNSIDHRTSLYRPTYTGSFAGVCIYFAMTHGGLPDESNAFTRSAAKWGSC